MRRTLLPCATAVALVALGVVGPLLFGPVARAAPTGDAFASSKLFRVETYRLANGLEVILQEDHRVPLVAVNVRYRVGSKDEVKGRTGFAHLFEHLMFRGSRHVPTGGFDHALESVGGSNNGTTNDDRTTYYETLPAHALDLALWLESDRMGFLLDRIDQATFETEREVVKNERRQTLENAPYGQIYEVMTEALYPPDHPYGHTTIGSMADLDAATVLDVKDFFRTYYVPSNATLILAGDFEAAAAKASITKYFATLPNAKVPTTVRTPKPVTLTGEKRIAMEAGVELPRLSIAWISPPDGTREDLALSIAGRVLGDGRTSRLQAPLVHEVQLAANLGVGERSAHLVSSFTIDVSVLPDKDPAAVVARIDQEIARLAQEGPSETEVERAKVQMRTRTFQAAERSVTRADMLGEAADVKGDPRYVVKQLEELKSLTRADVQNAVKRYLAHKNRVVVHVAVNPKAPVSGRVVKEGTP